MNSEYNVKVLENIFNELFITSERTLLESGGPEPVYLPATRTSGVNKIISTKDYFCSALHEVSHWCIAGLERRKLVDYGYWYEPDGRTDQQQKLFEQVEIKPQALEWLFTVATGHKFQLSVDNVNQPELKASDEFRSNVYLQAIKYLQYGLPDRANKFLELLLLRYRPDKPRLYIEEFQLEQLT